MPRNWLEWYERYDDPNDSLPQRLLAVTTAIRTFIDEAPPGRIDVLSLCSGDGRDLVSVAAGHPRQHDIRGRMVELHPVLAGRARAAVAAAGLAVDVVEGDAGALINVAGATPAQLVILCGIFGNISDADIRHTITSLPMLCTHGATVIWTRHRRDPDLTPAMLDWFTAVGCEHLDFTSPGAPSWTVGVERFMGRTAPLAESERLFTFDQEAIG